MSQPKVGPFVAVSCGFEFGRRRPISFAWFAMFVFVWLTVMLPCSSNRALAASAASTSRTNANSRTTAAKPVDLNRADAKALESLPGIGPALAERIVQGRPYRRVEDLERVKGIGKAKVESLRAFVTITPALPEAGSLAGSQSKTARTNPPPKQAGNVQRGSPPESERAAGAKLKPGEKININTATTEELQALPGIGPAKAGAIVEYRQEHGKFATAEEIQKVRGIKEGAFARIKSMIKVTD